MSTNKTEKIWKRSVDVISVSILVTLEFYKMLPLRETARGNMASQLKNTAAVFRQRLYCMPYIAARRSD